MRKHALLGLVLMVLCQWHCASRATPTGGPRDQQPPSIVVAESTTNLQTQFTERRIHLEMDEWIKLEDAQTQVLVSPPLEKRPTIRLKGRQVIFEFDDEEVLRENATYTINFGDAIQDLTEGNPLEHFSFVFSTGDQIDSLSIHGHLVDAFTSAPIEEAAILVYESPEDSIVFTNKPFYAARSDEDGSFQINNMKAGDYKIAAIVDGNLNYLYDAGSEQLGYLDTLFHLDVNQSQTIYLRMSMEVSPLYLDRVDTSHWNQALITYSRPPHEIDLTYEDDDGSLLHDFDGNNIINIWYHDAQRNQWTVYLRDRLSGITDTLSLRKNGPQSDVPTLLKKNRITNSGHPRDSFFICFDRPIQEIDTAYIILGIGKDVRPFAPEISIVDNLPMCVLLSNRWAPDSSYQITFLPGALTDLYGTTNDTIVERIPIGNEERFGTIILNLEGLTDSLTYFVELMDRDNPKAHFTTTGSGQITRTITKLKPATYTLRITEDLNANGRWDPVDYLKHLQPETSKTADIEPLRANWDVDVNFKWSN